MIPILDSIFNFKELVLWRTSDDRLGFAVEIEACDLETNHAQSYFDSLVHFLRNMDTQIITRVETYESIESSVYPEVSRSNSYLETGVLARKAILSIEICNEPKFINKIRTFIKGSFEDSRVNSLYECWLQLNLSGLNIKLLSTKEISNLFKDPNASWVKGDGIVSNGTELIGIIRQVKPGGLPVSTNGLAKVLSLVPKPFSVCVSFKRINYAKMNLDLQRRLKQSESQSDVKNSLINLSALSAIESSIKDGSQFIEYEYLIKFSRQSAETLRRDLKIALSQLNSIGEMAVETYGTAPSFLATLPGNNQHVSLIEMDHVLPILFPLWVNGETKIPTLERSSLLMQRMDNSLSDFNLFDKHFNVSNTLIVGTSGKGKSVLTGLLTQSLLNDPNISVIKIDVGGSHSKECKLMSGKEHVLRLDQKSGINPFQYLRSTLISDQEKISILSKFLAVLIQEQGEANLSKDIKEQIETCVSEYLSRSVSYSLQELFDKRLDFPRRNLLKRWVKGGVFENAFSSYLPDETKSNRLRYYNFSQVFQASDPDFAQAGLASVLAQFNFESLVSKDKRLVLICDETPFFIKTCFEFFKFSTANVRKFGHAVVLVSQLSTDLIVNGDSGIIENSPQRFLLSVDGSNSEYKERFNLSDEEMAKIQSLRTVPGKHSEILLSTPNWSKTFKLAVTSKEYWALTSSKKDNDKIESLLKAVPNLTLEQAIACLGI